MYLLARQANLRGLDIEKWAVEIGAAAASGIGNEVGVWATVLSPGVGTMTWTSRWDDLSAVEKGFANLMTDTKYRDLAAQGAEFLNGPVNDTLYETVYEGNAPSNDVTYVGICHSGVRARELRPRDDGRRSRLPKRWRRRPVRQRQFLAGQTGAYGTVVWIAGYKDIAAYEASQHALAADTNFVAMIDATTGAYQPDASITQATLHMRLG